MVVIGNFQIIFTLWYKKSLHKDILIKFIFLFHMYNNTCYKKLHRNCIRTWTGHQIMEKKINFGMMVPHIEYKIQVALGGGQRLLAVIRVKTVKSLYKAHLKKWNVHLICTRFVSFLVAVKGHFKSPEVKQWKHCKHYNSWRETCMNHMHCMYVSHIQYM